MSHPSACSCPRPPAPSAEGVCPHCQAVHGESTVVAFKPRDGRILTTRDFAILDNIARLQLPNHDPVGMALRAVLDDCRIVMPHDIPPDIVTLNARAVYTIDGQTREARVLVHRDAYGMSGGTISVATPIGAALLGLRAGTSTTFATRDGQRRTLALESVAYQPEAEERMVRPVPARSSERTIIPLRNRSRTAPPGLSPDDPGPGAA